MSPPAAETPPQATSGVGTGLLGPFSCVAEVPGASRLLVDLMGLPGASKHIFILIFLLLCPLGASCRHGSCCFEKPPYPDGVSGSSLGPRNLSCYRVSGPEYECSWEYDGSEDNVTHFLRCCFKPSGCCYFPAGLKRTVKFSEQAGVPVLSNVTFWVESRLGDRTLKSLEISLCLSNWSEFSVPLSHIVVSRPGGQLRMDWNVSSHEAGAEVQFRRRMPTTNWKLVDCKPQDHSGLGVIVDSHGSSSESYLCPSETMAQEFQLRRRRRLSSGAPGGPWSAWSKAVCVPPEPLPQPEVKFEVELGQDGRRQLTTQGQWLQQAVPKGCLKIKSEAWVSYVVHVRMLSCMCQARASWKVPLGKTLNLSEAAYKLVVVAKTRFGRSSYHTWRLPAQEIAETRTLNVSVEGNVTSVHWAARAPGTTYCVERQTRGADRNLTHCTLIAPEDGDSGETVMHSWSPESAREQEECHRVTIFASKNPQNAEQWSTVLRGYYFGGNASVTGIPRHVSVRNHSGDSVSVEWTPSKLSACPGVLTRYVVRCETEDGTGVSEWLVPPTKTQVTLQGLRSGVMYKVQVRADTARLPGAWSRPQSFSFGVQISRLSIVFASLGSFASVLLMGGLGYIGLNRVAWYLCPPLPTPCASTAVEFPGSQGKQAWQWLNPEDFPETLCPRETLVVETPPDGEDETESPQAASNPSLDTTGPLETRRLSWEDCPGGGLAQVTLPLLLGDVAQGAPDLWWLQKTEEPGLPTYPLGQED
ncbi:interleukin-12 receptor subunit beta-1 [Acomys russatus]|uniref:interleukin-12 receptor subunit beta-1 n=1 Tax=Acomys russatus TaxID=60746 RepID=UPI0021E1D04D|nr:interleukin-12 receptor subunit beta-1 [Acomys russatus]